MATGASLPSRPRPPARVAGGGSLSRLGVIVALPFEGRALAGRAFRPGRSFEVGGTAVLLAGVGAGRAAKAARSLVRDDATALASWGVAGALDPGIRSGTVVVPTLVADGDGVEYPVEAAWRTRIEHRLGSDLPVVGGRLAQASRVLATPGEKALAREATRAAAVDLESASIAAVAREANLPFVAIRAIADEAGEPLPESVTHAYDASGRIRPLRLATRLMRGSSDFGDIVRAVRAFRAAETALSEVGRRTGPGLLAP